MDDTAGVNCVYGLTPQTNQYYTDGAHPITHNSQHALANYQNITYSY